MLLHGGDAFVIDPKMLGYASRLQHEVEVELGRKVRRQLLTHHHYDHAAGAVEFKHTGAVLIHPAAKARLLEESEAACAREPGPLCALPYLEVATSAHLWLGPDEVQVLNLGAGHTDGDLVAWFPERKLLVAGDLVMSGYWPHIDAEAGGDFLTLAATLDALLALPFEKVVPGHGDIGGREVVEQQRAYLRALEEDVRSALESGADEAMAAKTVKLRPGFKALSPIPGDAHEKQVRLMYRAVTRPVHTERSGTK